MGKAKKAKVVIKLRAKVHKAKRHVIRKIRALKVHALKIKAIPKISTHRHKKVVHRLRKVKKVFKKKVAKVIHHIRKLRIVLKKKVVPKAKKVTVVKKIKFLRHQKKHFKRHA